QVIAKIKKYENSGEINFKIADKKSAMDSVKDFYLKQRKPQAFFDFDGYRIEYKDWWFNIRASNTEPYMRLLVEANTTDKVRQKVLQIRSIIEKYM
ncbi:MAG: hypothetical protein R2750_05560, partial [Bacteroidales bacterium]